MAFLTIAAEEVQVGDALYMGDEYAKNPNHRYSNVRRIRRMNNPKGPQIWIVAGKVDYLYNPTDQVQIQRLD